MSKDQNDDRRTTVTTTVIHPLEVMGEDSRERKRKIEHELGGMNDMLLQMTKKQTHHLVMQEEAMNRTIFSFIRSITSIRERMLANHVNDPSIDCELKHEIAAMERQARLFLEGLDDPRQLSSRSCGSVSIQASLETATTQASSQASSS